MTVSSLLPARAWKEIRGLSPAWLACLASMIVAVGLGGRSQVLGLAGYFLGAVALGGLSMGHEYSARTLTLFLSQPATRERLFLEKLGVLAMMLLMLSAVAWFGLSDLASQSGLGVHSARNWWTLAVGLPLLCGLFIAPWLTMVCRSAMAGIVFALAIPGTVWLASDFASAMTYGGDLSALAEASDFTFDVFWRGMLIVSVMAAASSWRMFMRLEAIDSRGLEVGLPAWLARRAGPMAAAPAFARRRAMWLLARKELRLQQLTFAVSGLYVLGWIGLLWFKQVSPATRTTLLWTLTVFHLGAIPLLAGSLASAEERQLGTLEWQVLLPIAGWKQWLMKAAVAVAIALTLTLGLPALLLYFNTSPAIRGEVGPLTSASIGWAVTPIVVIGLYISSMCANGLRALLISVPAAFAVFVMVGSTRAYSGWDWTFSQMWRFWVSIYSNPAMFAPEERGFLLYRGLMNVLVIMMYAGVLGILLRFALTNHRSAERGAPRVWKQMLRLVAFLAIGITLWSGVSRLYAAELDEAYRIRRLKSAAVSGVAMDRRNNLVKSYTLIIFREGTSQLREFSYSAYVNSAGEFYSMWLRPGQYFFVATEKLEQGAERDPELLARLKTLAMPVTLEAGDSKAISLMLSRF